MTGESFDVSDPQRLTVGAEGAPGHRLFFLQARDGPLLVTLKMEKVQVAALAAWIAKTLDDLPALGHLPEDDDLLPEPFAEPAWAVGSLGGTYDAELDRMVLVATEIGDASLEEEGDDEPTEPTEPTEPGAGEPGAGATARFLATREQMAALAIRAARLVEAGRPPCPLCGYPLDPTGHQCPRTNGNRPPQL
jgi:uncharacterized repeat protein (TIGR03847 family)